jgi:exopolyphosphatase / guanosine-5'-triphosphate,3'-diphosphate pyrophosphatase
MSADGTVHTHMKLAAIDLGSNSIHMVIVETEHYRATEINPDAPAAARPRRDRERAGSFRVIGAEKEMVRLGAGTLVRGKLSAAAMRRGLDVLRNYKSLATSAGVDKIVAVATSAVREAVNGEDFLNRVGEELGIWAKAISGEEEARLIYQAALFSIHLEGRRALVLDIGGGSVELALGAGRDLELAVSLKLGVLRMTEKFVKSDPLARRDESRLVRHVQAALAPHAGALTANGPATLVGTSGTILAVGALALELELGTLPETLHHVAVSAASIHTARKWLVGSDVRERLRSRGLDEKRADIVVAGAVVLDTILQEVEATEIVLCEAALREGLIVDYIQEHPRSLARASAYPDVRRRSVMALAERCRFDAAHAQQAARLALALFDGTRRRHRLGADARALLEYAALLHDVGHHISYPRHHKHTYYLIKNAGLQGFTPGEVEVLANVARYHRRGHPRRKHPGYGGLDSTQRASVRVLAGCLRLADALDRSHRSVVKSLTVTDRAGRLRVHCEVSGDAALELWGVPRRAKLLEEELAVRVEVRAVPASAAADPVERPAAPTLVRSREGRA